MTFLLQLFFLCAGLWIVGVGLCLLFRREMRSFTSSPMETTFFVAPLIPLTALSILGWYCYRWFGVSIQSSALPISVGLSCLTAMGYLRYRSALVKNLVHDITSFTTAESRFLLAAPFFFTLVSTFIFWFADQGRPVSIDGVDWPSYAQMANYLKIHHFGSSASGFYLQNQETYQYLIQENVFGAFYAIGFLSELFHLDIAISTSLILSAHVFFALVLAGQVYRRVFRLDWRQNLLLLALYSFSPLNSLVLSSGYISQTIAVCLLLALLLIVLELLSAFGSSESRPVESGVLAGLLITAIVHFYSHMIGPVGLTLALFVFMWRRNQAQWTRSAFAPADLRFLATVFGVFGVVIAGGCADRIYWMVSNSKTLFTVNAGPGLPTMNADILFGFFFSTDLKSPNEIFRQAANLVVIGALTKSMIRFRKSSGAMFALSLAVLISIVAVMTSLSAFGVPARGYKIFKLLSFYLALLLPIAFSDFLYRKIGRIFLGVLAIVNLFYLFQFNRQLVESGQRVPTTAPFQAHLPETQSLNVLSLGSTWERQWVTARLQDRTLYFLDDLFGVPGTALSGGTFLLTPSAWTALHLKNNHRHLVWMDGIQRSQKYLIPCGQDQGFSAANSVFCYHGNSNEPQPTKKNPELPELRILKQSCEGRRFQAVLQMPRFSRSIFRLTFHEDSGIELGTYRVRASLDTMEKVLSSGKCSSRFSCSGAFSVESPDSPQSPAGNSVLSIIDFEFKAGNPPDLKPTPTQEETLDCGQKLLDFIVVLPGER